MLVPMASTDRRHDASVELDGRLRAAVEAGDVDGATRLALEAHGSEIIGFLLSVHRDEATAAEVFSVVSEAVWRKIASFTWERSTRTWVFAIARRASLHHRRDAARRRARVEPLSAVSEVAEKIRTATLSYLRTARRDKLDALREALPPEDRALLFLRLDRRLAWNDLAVALCSEEDQPLDDERLKREAARLRKRFQLLKDRLRERALEEGLLSSPEDR
jgi:RNA polymerase sigma-70 factor, ECF subfamily